MGPTFGIKTGNSTICVAATKEDGKVEVVANKHGNRVSHAVLLISGEIEVGLTAKQKLTSRGMCSVVNNFQFLSKNLSPEQVQHAVKYLTCHYNVTEDKYELRKPPQPDCSFAESTEVGSISPYEVCIEFFKASFELARQCHLLEENPSVVLSIPIYYPPACWSILAECAEAAGFHVSQVITEHTAALLAYEHLIGNKVAKRVLCIKSGGLLTSMSLLTVKDGLISLIRSAGPYYIGGKQFTDVLKEFICTEFFRKYGLDANESRRSIAKVEIAAEDCKHILTALTSTHIYIDSLMDGIDFKLQMSRARYEMLMQPVLNNFMSILNESVGLLLREAENQTIDEIVIAGGTMKIPKIQSTIKARFPDAIVNCDLPPDEIVAIGCAIQSICMNTNEQDDSGTESEARCSCIPNDIYIWQNREDLKQLLFERGSLLPMHTLVEFGCFEDELLEGCGSASPDVTFHVQMAHCTGEIRIANTRNSSDRYQIKATIEAIDGLPQITLAHAN